MMEVTGGCHCGHLKFRADINPEMVVVCHCTDCQTLSGSAFRTVAMTEPDGFELLAGEMKIYIKMADSGNQRQQGFCPECGTPIYATSVDDGPKVYGLRVGTITQRASLVPKKQVWHRSALDWIDHIGELPAVDGQPQ